MRTVPILLILFLLAGCTGPADPPDPPLTGRTFVSTAVTEGGTPVAVFTGVRVRVTFKSREISVYADCNASTARVRYEGGRITASDQMTTMIGCKDDARNRDRWLSDLLDADPAYELDGSVLVLRSGARELRLIDEAVASAAPTPSGTR